MQVGDAIHFEVVRFQVVVVPILAAAGTIQVASVDSIGSWGWSGAWVFLSIFVVAVVLCRVGCAHACFESGNCDLVGWGMVVVVFVVEVYDGDGGRCSLFPCVGVVVG
ncbi:hypothetical protein Acr_00g0060510 [Actinidia rufa]|uniref:Uncharacterized protein n=1 Tax=Actinidia rufa TaxID=165716 RepID=A0A7J0DNE2_9ERIC|nr:hypothetical protein Acr_00g0060510 [Actinidia rufa]